MVGVAVLGVSIAQLSSAQQLSWWRIKVLLVATAARAPACSLALPTKGEGKGGTEGGGGAGDYPASVTAEGRREGKDSFALVLVVFLLPLLPPLLLFLRWLVVVCRLLNGYAKD